MSQRTALSAWGISLVAAALGAASAGDARAAWQADTPLPAAYVLTKTVAGGGFLYQFGGLGDKGICGTQDVNVARLNADGSAGAWTPTTPLPNVGTSTLTYTCGGIDYTMNDVVIGWGYEAVYSQGYVYLLGGNRWNFNGWPEGTRIRFSSDVFYAKANADGSLGAWIKAASLPFASFDAAAAASNGTIYVTGGRDDATTTNVRRDTFYSRLNADGSPAAWQASAYPMPGGLWMHSAAIAAGRLYISGGVTYDPWPRDDITDAVFSAPLAADGTPGDWRAESLLPIGLAGHGMRARHGTLYTIGGEEPSFPSASVHAAPAGPDGVLTAWGDADTLPLPLHMHGSASLGDALYAAGGNDGSVPQRAVYRLPDAIAPSAVTDLAAVALDSSSLRAQWSAPGNDGVYGAVSGGRYELRVSADPAGLDAAAPVVWTASFAPGDAQARTVTGLTGGVTYYLSLRAADSAGNLSAGSNAAFAATLPPPPPNPPPLAASLLPGSAVAGGPAFTLTVDGANFVDGAVVSWNGSGRATTYVSASRLTAAVAAADVAAAGSAVIAVFNPAPGGGFSPPLNFPILNPAPSVSSLSPSAATAGGAAFTLTVNGVNFVDGSVVTWNGASRPTVFASASQLTAAIGAADIASAGGDSVAVFTPGPGGGTSAPAAFVVGAPAPVAVSLSPASSAAGSAAFALTVNGSGFTSASVVRWNGSDRATAYASASQLTAAISSADVAAAGSGSVTVYTPAPGGGTSAPLAFAIENPAPAAASLSPDSATAGGPAFTLTVTGSGFVGGSVVRWNGADRPTTYAGAGRLTAAIGAGDIATAGSADVAVFNPAPGGGLSAPASFAVVPPPPGAPSLTSLSPASATAGGAGFTLTVDGADFTADTVVQWNGSPRPTVVLGSARMTAAISAADVAAAGVAVVTAFTPAPGGGTSGPGTFTVNNPAPALASLSPASATAGDEGFTLTVNGSGFVGGSVVRWNGSDRATAFVSTSRLTAAISAADVASAGTGAVTVFSPAPGGGATPPASFAVLPPPNPAPALSGLSPASAAAGSAGFTLTVNGSNFVAGSVVRWNGADRPTTFAGAAQLTAAISAADVAAAGTESVAVFTPAPGGGTSAAAPFAVLNPAPAAASLSPNSAAAGAAAFTLTVNGSGFVNGSVVRWNGSDRATTFVSASQLTAEIPAGDVAAAGSASVTAFTPAPGGGQSAPVPFSISAPAPATAAVYAAFFSPRTLNLKSNGNFVKVVLQGADSEESEEASVTGLRLVAVDGAAIAPIDAAPAARGDSDGDGREDLELSFSRSAVEAVLRIGTHSFTVTGTLRNGTAFSASGSLNVIDPPNKSAQRAASGPRSDGGPHFWPAPAAIMAVKTMAWDDPEPFSPDGKVKRVSNGRVAVRVPDGAAPPAAALTISTAAAEAEPDAVVRKMKTEDTGLTEVSAPVVFGPEGTHFDKPVTLELPYDRRKLPRGVTEANLAIHYWNPATQQWEKLPSIVDRQAQIVRAQTSHFSLYQVLTGAAPQAAAPAAASSGVGLVKVWPNPFRPSQGHRKVNLDSLPAGARIRVYTLAGALVQELTADGSGHAEWLGNNKSGASAASGVYFVLLEGTGGKKIVKVAVQR